MGEDKTLGILLNKTLLANDDAVLDFFTAEFGRVALFVKKFARSPKKMREVDFFRLLELEIFQGRNSKSMKNVACVTLFPQFSSGYQVMEKGFEWMTTLRRVLPEEKPDSAFFQEISHLMNSCHPDDLEKYDAFFRIKCLSFSGVLPRFDQLRGDVYFDPEAFSFSLEARPHKRLIPNLTRQIIEFMRRSDFETFHQKRAKLPKENFKVLHTVLSDIDRFHL